MSHIGWIYPFDLSGDEETRQYIERQPYFMLKCSKIIGASYVKEISKNDIPDISTEGYIYFNNEEQKFFVLHKHCSYLLGVFDLEKKRIFQQEYDSIKEKSEFWHCCYNEFKKFQVCVSYQTCVQSLLSNDSDEYNKSLELLNYFKEKFDECKIKIEELEKEIQSMIREYISQELRIFLQKSNGINIEANVCYYLEYFINKKY